MWVWKTFDLTHPPPPNDLTLKKNYKFFIISIYKYKHMYDNVYTNFPSDVGLVDHVCI